MTELLFDTRVLLHLFSCLLQEIPTFPKVILGGRLYVCALVLVLTQCSDQYSIREHKETDSPPSPFCFILSLLKQTEHFSFPLNKITQSQK